MLSSLKVLLCGCGAGGLPPEGSQI